jgi:glycosyltransferase involved in cell wall biosynthesis
MSSRGVKVALLTPCFWPEVRRGAERILRELADGLLEDGHRPRLITSHPGLPSRGVEDGLEIVRNWRPPDSRLVRRGFEDYMTHVPFSYRSLVGGEDEIAQAVFVTDALAAVRWSERTGRPAIFSYMGIPDHLALTNRRFRRRFTERVCGTATVVALSRFVADAFERWLGVEAPVIYPGVDLESFQPAPERFEEPTIFCAASADVDRKRVPLLVEAFGILRRRRPNARLRLLRPAAPRSAARLERVPGVELVEPVQDPSDLAPEYGRAWVSALPSVYEALGVVLLESLACGTPVVATNRDAMPEVVDRPEVGRLFDEGPEDLARALEESLELASANGSIEACRSRAADFSTRRTTEAYVALYRELLA